MTATLPETRVLADDFRGTLAVNDGVVCYLTPCCQASIKGSANSPTGVCCRACYTPVPLKLAAGWMADDASAWMKYADDLYAAALADGASDTPTNRQVMDRVAIRAVAAATRR